MPFYELFCISRATLGNKQTTDLLRSSITHILSRGGVVRNIENMGSSQLPYRMKTHQEIFDQGRYWFMTFDASPSTMDSLYRTLKHDERVIRHAVVKVADTLPGIVHSIEEEQRRKNAL